MHFLNIFIIKLNGDIYENIFYKKKLYYNAHFYINNINILFSTYYTLRRYYYVY